MEAMTKIQGSAVSDRNPHRLYDIRVSSGDGVDKAELAKFSQDADAGVLVAVLAQLEGNMTAIERFGPLLETDLAPNWQSLNPPRRLPAPMMAELIDRLADAMSSRQGGQDIRLPLPEDFARALEVAVGESIPVEFIPVIEEQAGFVASVPVVPRTVDPSDKYNVIILGAGMSGIGAAIACGDGGFEYEVFEASNDIGGTWRINTYPGAGVDTASVYYSYSFEIETNWSKFYPTGNEYQNYLRKVVDKYGVKERIRFNTEITAMHWDESAQEWVVTARSGSEIITKRAKFVITATGFLTRPSYPNVPGREDFKGLSLHSTQWTPNVDLRGKRVGIVGAGATAVQIVDAIQDTVEQMTIFQRQPHWIMPTIHMDGGAVPETEIWLQEHVPYYAQWQRAKTYWFISDRNYDAIRVDREWMRTHPDSISETNQQMMLYARGHLERSFGHDPELLKKLTPDFPFFGKRPIRDPGRYYTAIASGKADVVASAITRILPNGIETADGTQVELDVIVYACGFHLDYLSKMDIVGRNGVKLVDQWLGGTEPRAYLGGTVPNFPNLFVTSAPNSANGHGGGHNFMTEVAQHYILECMQVVVNAGADSIEVTEEAEAAYLDDMTKQLEDSIWRNRSGAHTYYTSPSGRVVMPNPWRMVDFWEMNRTPKLDKFDVR